MDHRSHVRNITVGHRNVAYMRPVRTTDTRREEVVSPLRNMSYDISRGVRTTDVSEYSHLGPLRSE